MVDDSPTALAIVGWKVIAKGTAAVADATPLASQWRREILSCCGVAIVATMPSVEDDAPSNGE